jgi:hypothetical protein
MKAVLIEGAGGPEVLAVRERPTPEPGVEQVRVRVRAAGGVPDVFFTVYDALFSQAGLASGEAVFIHALRIG